MKRKKPNKIKIPTTIFYFENKNLLVPILIGNKYTPIRFLPLSNLEKLKSHKRLQVFYHKGFLCASGCGKIGKYLIEAQEANGRKHIDLYTEDFELMTVDHIKPKSKGGTNELDNYQPMCLTCNQKKKDIYHGSE